MKKIAIIGGGATGIALAADMTLSGHEVSIFEELEYGENLEELKRVGCIRKRDVVNKQMFRFLK